MLIANTVRLEPQRPTENSKSESVPSTTEIPGRDVRSLESISPILASAPLEFSQQSFAESPDRTNKLHPIFEPPDRCLGASPGRS